MRNFFALKSLHYSLTITLIKITSLKPHTFVGCWIEVFTKKKLSDRRISGSLVLDFLITSLLPNFTLQYYENNYSNIAHWMEIFINI